MGFGWQEIDKTLDLGYIRVAELHRECKPAVLFDPPNFCPCTMTHVHTYVHTIHTYVRIYSMYVHAYVWALSYVCMYIHTYMYVQQKLVCKIA